MGIFEGGSDNEGESDGGGDDVVPSPKDSIRLCWCMRFVGGSCRVLGD
jgi:hypothetical protein